MEEKRPAAESPATEQIAPGAMPPDPPAKRKKREDYLPLRIVTMAVYVVIACFLLYWLTDCIIKMHSNDSTSGLNVLLLVVILLSWGSIANAVPTVMAIVGAVLSKKRIRSRGEKGVPVYFIVMSILPYATELLVIGVTYLLPHLFP